MKHAGVVRRKFGRLILGVLATVFLGMGLYRLSVLAFTIRSIEVVGENVDVSIDEKRISTNLLFFASDVLREEVLADNPWLSDVRFEKKFPSTLRIVVQKRNPVAILESGDRIVLLGDNGVVLSNADEKSTLPRLSLSVKPYRVGEKLNDQSVQQALALIQALSKELIITSVTYMEGGYLRAKSETLDIIIVQDRSIVETLATLQMLLSGFRIKGTLPAVVDLRFDKPIVTF